MLGNRLIHHSKSPKLVHTNRPTKMMGERRRDCWKKSREKGGGGVESEEGEGRGGNEELGGIEEGRGGRGGWRERRAVQRCLLVHLTFKIHQQKTHTSNIVFCWCALEIITYTPSGPHRKKGETKNNGRLSPYFHF
jgi:hypothetical protein